MKDLSHEFNLLNNCETSYSANIHKSHEIDKICNKMSDEIFQNYDADVNKQKDLKDFLYETQNSIKINIDDSVNQVMQIYHRGIHKVLKI